MCDVCSAHRGQLLWLFLRGVMVAEDGARAEAAVHQGRQIEDRSPHSPHVTAKSRHGRTTAVTVWASSGSHMFPMSRASSVAVQKQDSAAFFPRGEDIALPDRCETWVEFRDERRDPSTGLLRGGQFAPDIIQASLSVPELQNLHRYPTHSLLDLLVHKRSR